MGAWNAPTQKTTTKKQVMKNRKEIVDMLEELYDRYIYDREMVLYNTTDIMKVTITSNFESFVTESTMNNLKDLVHNIYNEYEWDDEAESILDDIWAGIDAMLEYYKMVQPTEVVYDENGVDNGMRMINIYKMQGFISAIDDGITAIDDLIEMVGTEE